MQCTKVWIQERAKFLRNLLVNASDDEYLPHTPSPQLSNDLPEDAEEETSFVTMRIGGTGKWHSMFMLRVTASEDDSGQIYSLSCKLPNNLLTRRQRRKGQRIKMVVIFLNCYTSSKHCIQ